MYCRAVPPINRCQRHGVARADAREQCFVGRGVD